MLGSKNTFDVTQYLDADILATEIADLQRTWTYARATKVLEWEELSRYIFATDTRTTSNSMLPWKNNTTLPKLCQIRDTLHALYMAILFPKKNWLSWESTNKATPPEKINTIRHYVADKIRLSKFKTTVSQLVLDWIDHGNCFATVEFVHERFKDKVTEEEYDGYVGPKLVRISPYDIVFDPTAADFASTNKIIRNLVSPGKLKQILVSKYTTDAAKQAEGVLKYVMGVRKSVREGVSASTSAGGMQEDSPKNDAYRADGFSSYREYFNQDMIELLHFYGTIYDTETDTLYENREIIIVDRHKIVYNEPISSWIPGGNILHCGWRQRPDNLWAMGPLDNLVGMQYRIDHLENLKADVFDLIAFPVITVKGYVNNFEWQPFEKILMGDDGEVNVLSPDAQALNADFQIQLLEKKMEEMAGVPREALGFRTPGEKTAFEVQRQENASLRLFQNKTEYFEELFLEPIVNLMLEVGRRNLDTVDSIRSFDDELSIEIFQTIVKADITGSGRIMPLGARNFKEKAELIQNLQNLGNSTMFTDPAIINHISGKKIAQLIEEVLDLQDYKLVQDNIRIIEQTESQQQINTAQEIIASTAMTPGLGENAI